MFTVSPLQAIEVWEELMQCLYGDNRYGSTVAEIYLFRVMPLSPYVTAGRPARDMPDSWFGKQFQTEAYAEANKALFELCKLFEKRHDVKLALFDGPMKELVPGQQGWQTGPLPLEDLIADPENPWTHRVHIGILSTPEQLAEAS